MDREFRDLKEEFHSSQYKITPQRQAILQVIQQNSSRHLSAEDIYGILRDSAEQIGLATVYRTLDLFVELNILHRVDFGDGRSRYELAPYRRHRHHHLICLRCGKVTEAKEDLLNHLEEIIEQESGFQVIDHSVKFYGYCQECRGRAAQPQVPHA